jgi:PilZ domain
VYFGKGYWSVPRYSSHFSVYCTEPIREKRLRKPIGCRAEIAVREADRMKEIGLGGAAVVDGAKVPGKRREQRSEERYPVQLDAEIFVPARATMFRGRIMNFSPSGCYVQTVAWVRLPPTTVVEVVFALNGRMVRARAEARFAQSKTGVGLRFLAQDEQTQAKLDEVSAGLRLSAAEARNGEEGKPTAVAAAALVRADAGVGAAAAGTSVTGEK